MAIDTKKNIKLDIPVQIEESAEKKIFKKNNQKVFKGESAIHALGYWVPETIVKT